MDHIVKSYGFLSFAKRMGRSIGKNISKNLSSKHSQKNIDHANQSARDALKTASKRAIQKIAEATGHSVGKKIANRITKISKKSQQNKLKTVKNEHAEEISKEKYVSLKERQEIIDELRLK